MFLGEKIRQKAERKHSIDFFLIGTSQPKRVSRYIMNFSHLLHSCPIFHGGSLSLIIARVRICQFYFSQPSGKLAITLYLWEVSISSKEDNYYLIIKY